MAISLRALSWPLGSRKGKGGLLEGEAWGRERQKKEGRGREKGEVGEGRREEAHKATTTESQKGSGDQDAGERAQDSRLRRPEGNRGWAYLNAFYRSLLPGHCSYLSPPPLLIFPSQSAI